MHIKSCKAIFNFFSNMQNDYFNTETLMLLIETYVESIVNYGCEVWGFHKASETDTLHLQILKRIRKAKKALQII